MLSPQEIAKVQSFMRLKFGNDRIALKQRKTDDSVEVLVGGEFLGVIYRDEDEGEISYAFNMAILEIDLADL